MNEQIENNAHIAQTVARITEEITRAAARAGRCAEDITLIAVSKNQSSAAIRAAIAAGVRVCGENRVQELLSHQEDKAYAGAQCHFIGQLQTNKVRHIMGQVSLIQSVDSSRLLDEIEKQAEKHNLCQDILLEVNIGREESKGGVFPEQLPILVEYAQKLAHIRLRGLMCIPPAQADEARLGGLFAQTQKLLVDTRNKMGDNKSDMDCLSMGMSGDFSLAIAEGATMIRVGTALFGARPSTR